RIGEKAASFCEASTDCLRKVCHRYGEQASFLLDVARSNTSRWLQRQHWRPDSIRLLSRNSGLAWDGFAFCSPALTGNSEWKSISSCKKVDLQRVLASLNTVCQCKAGIEPPQRLNASAWMKSSALAIRANVNFRS